MKKHTSTCTSNTWVHHSRLVTRFSLAIPVHPAMQTHVQMNDVYQQDSCIHVHVCAGAYLTFVWWPSFAPCAFLRVWLSPPLETEDADRHEENIFSSTWKHTVTGIGLTTQDQHSTWCMLRGSGSSTSEARLMFSTSLSRSRMGRNWAFILLTKQTEREMDSHIFS